MPDSPTAGLQRRQACAPHFDGERYPIVPHLIQMKTQPTNPNPKFRITPRRKISFFFSTKENQGKWPSLSSMLASTLSTSTQMETILFSSSSNPTLNPKSIISKSPSLPRLNKPIVSSVLKKPFQSTYLSLSSHNRDWLSFVHHGLAAAAISIAINFCPLPTTTGFAMASEFDVLNEGPPSDSYVVDDAGVLSRVTKSDLKRIFSDLESRKNLHVNFITVRKLTSKADAFEYADQVLEKWYPTVEEGNNKGIVVLVTSQKEGAITGGPTFIEAVGEKVLDAIVSENLPVLATDEKYNEAMISTANRLVAAIDGLPDPGGPTFKDNKRESNFKSREETEEKRGQFSLVVGGLLVIAFVVPMAQYYAYVSRK